MRARRLVFAALFTLFAAAVSPSTAHAAPDTAASAAGVTLPSQVLDALQRDLGLSAAEVQTRLANEAAADDVTSQMQEELGASFAGAWLAGDEGILTVAVTDQAESDEVRAAGAVPTVVSRSEHHLDAVQAALDRSESSAPASVSGWFVDVTTNTVVVETGPDGVSAAQGFVAQTGVDAAAVRVEVTDEQPQLFYDVRGGDAYYTPQFRCSIGFSVRGGFTTAGHCGRTGTTTSGYNRVAQGSFGGSVFPGNDYAWVRVNSNWVPRGVVNNYRGGTVAVRGSTVAAIGASVCRSGSTTGWRCGTIQARNQTVRYPQGTVNGLTRTSACAEGGDSGGSFISGNQAQGMTSGGSGNCTFGGTTFFQPLNPTLSRFGLTLVTS